MPPDFACIGRPGILVVITNMRIAIGTRFLFIMSTPFNHDGIQNTPKLRCSSSPPSKSNSSESNVCHLKFQEFEYDVCRIGPSLIKSHQRLETGHFGSAILEIISICVTPFGIGSALHCASQFVQPPSGQLEAFYDYFVCSLLGEALRSAPPSLIEVPVP